MNRILVKCSLPKNDGIKDTTMKPRIKTTRTLAMIVTLLFFMVFLFGSLISKSTRLYTDPVRPLEPITTSGDCSPVITDAGNILLSCSPGSLPVPSNTEPCGPNGLCSSDVSELIDVCSLSPLMCQPQAPFQAIDREAYAFNAPVDMQVLEPETIALVIDTTGETNFDNELETLPGAQLTGTTPVSLIMEAEIVAPAFEITPSGRQRRQLSTLNPTRWDWEVSPNRGGQHQLEMSLYIVAISNGESILEEKALAERRIINVTVSPLDTVSEFISEIDPIFAFIIAIGSSIAAIFAWFGIKGWRDISNDGLDEETPQKIEITIKETIKSDKSSGKNVP